MGPCRPLNQGDWGKIKPQFRDALTPQTALFNYKKSFFLVEKNLISIGITTYFESKNKERVFETIDVLDSNTHCFLSYFETPWMLLREKHAVLGLSSCKDYYMFFNTSPRHQIETRRPFQCPFLPFFGISCRHFHHFSKSFLSFYAAKWRALSYSLRQNRPWFEADCMIFPRDFTRSFDFFFETNWLTTSYKLIQNNACSARKPEAFQMHSLWEVICKGFCFALTHIPLTFFWTQKRA